MRRFERKGLGGMYGFKDSDAILVKLDVDVYIMYEEERTTRLVSYVGFNLITFMAL
jgi:hypothetical protein